MDTNAFLAGVVPGGLTNKVEIKVLICYLLKNIGVPLSFERLNEIFQDTSVVNYFEFSDAFSDLKETGHVRLSSSSSDERYELTDLGRTTADTLFKSIPASVRDKVLSCALLLLSKMRHEEETATKITKVDDGYTVNMKILDTGTDLLNLEVFLPHKFQAESVRDFFLSNPEYVYRGILALLTGDSKTFGEISLKIDKNA